MNHRMYETILLVIKRTQRTFYLGELKKKKRNTTFRSILYKKYFMKR